ncbi:MAG TPA: ABC transporter permease, partial [Chthoniobacteraceae bacterium]|nr:ABC transporter permease [Chthoniobacteraceae bacterium]
MRVGNTIKISLRALRRNLLRSLLTALGIIIGVGAVIAVVSIGNGTRVQIQSQIASLGENVILVFAGNFSPGGVRSGWGGAGTLMVPDADAIKREIPKVVAVSPEVRSGAQLVAGNQNWATQNLQGESEDYLDIRQWPVAAGGGFTEQDVRSANKVAIIGKTIANSLYPGEDPVGQVLRIRNVPFIVTGVLSSKGLNMLGQDQDDIVIVPYTSAMKRLMGRTNLSSMIVQVDKASNIDSAESEIVSLLRQRHKIIPPKDDDFTVRNEEEITKVATSTTDLMTLFVAFIAAVSLFVGGIGVMNIMLVSVTERTREIGIRIAVGAHARDIMLQFLIEALTLSSMGGVIGILAGVGAAQLLSYFMHSPYAISIPWVIISFLTSAGIGIAFGFFPASKASQLDPIEALRYE